MNEENERQYLESFVFYRSFLETIEMLPSESDQLKLIKAICEYGFTGVEPVLDYPLNIALHQIVASIGSATSRWLKCKETGKLGGAPKNNQNSRGRGAPKGNKNASKTAKQKNNSKTKKQTIEMPENPCATTLCSKTNNLNNNKNENKNINNNISYFHSDENKNSIVADDAAPDGASSPTMQATSWLGEAYDDGAGNVFRDYRTDDGTVRTVRIE